MADRDILLEQGNLEGQFDYAHVKTEADRLLAGRTAAGIEYACLKFLQDFCIPAGNPTEWDIFQQGDPRTPREVVRLAKEQWHFVLRGDTAQDDQPSSHENPQMSAQRNAESADPGGGTKSTGSDKPQKGETRDNFLNRSDDFIQWMVDALNEFPGFSHWWRARGDISKGGFPKGTLWAATSIFSAYQQYLWPAKVNTHRSTWEGRFFDETEKFLEGLGDSLKKAIENTRAKESKDYAFDVLAWGGVAQRPNTIAPHIHAGIPEASLVQHLQETTGHLRDLCENGFSEDYAGFVDGNGHELRLDSGTTKIYSLLIDEFVMYDGRVASALGYLVRKWWETQWKEDGPVDYNGIPKSLCFSFDYAKVDKQLDSADQKYRCRNPNPPGNNNPFKPLKVGTQRVKENIRVSWLIRQVLKVDKKRGTSRSNFGFINPMARRLRALEAAIFMLGYDVSETPISRGR